MKTYKKRLLVGKIKQNIYIGLIWVFCFIGCLSVLNWSINVFVEAGEFWFSSRKVSYELKNRSLSSASFDFNNLSPRSPKNLIQAYFEDDRTALAVATAESGLNPDQPSTTDITDNGVVYSWGIFQINLTKNPIGSLDCPSAFKGSNNNAVIVNETLYNECVDLAKNPEINIATARKIYDQGGWSRWGAYLNGSYLRWM